MPDAPIHPERIARALTLLSYLLAEERGDRVPLAAVVRDLGVTRAQVREDLSLLNLVNHGGGTYVIYGELIGDSISVTQGTLWRSHGLARPPLTAHGACAAARRGPGG